MSAGPLPGLLAPITVPASWGFGLAVAWRNRRFDAGSGVVRVPVPVISIGNITVGGTGKTPMVAWVTSVLRDAGRAPVIAMRGYGARPGERSDEEREYALTSPDTPVIARADRARAISEAIESGSTMDCVVLDDGFQHRMLVRDLDLVLIDATRPGFGDRLLPAGWLREPPSALRRASAVIVTRSEQHGDRHGRLAHEIERWHGRPPLAWAMHAWRDLSVWTDGARERMPVSWLAERKVIAVFGTGNPRSIEASVAAAGAHILMVMPRSDHARYAAADVAHLVNMARSMHADAIITTRKDWTKLAPLVRAAETAHAQDLRDTAHLPLPSIPFVVPELAIEMRSGETALRELIRAAASRSPAGSPPQHG